MNKENKKFIIETLFLKESLKRDLSLKEFLVLMYFDNDYDSFFDVKKVAKATCLNEKDVLSAFGMLLDKNLLTLVSVKNDNGKIVDKISLDNLYTGIKKATETEKSTKEKQDFFSKFQKEYSHTLSSMDFELVKAWLDSGFSEELILGAVKEANYNGVASLSYIDKVLFAWKKKGFKTMDDVNKHLTKQDDNDEDDEAMFETSVFDVNWLEDE